MLIACLVQPAFADSMAPIAENLEIKTYKNVSVGGNLSAFDPDGDGVSFEISTAPVKGTIDLRDDGSFIHTPWENKKGKDYFGYRAIDSDGSRSQEATVIVTIQKQKKDVAYSDIVGSEIEYAAVTLSEHDIFTGEQIGGHYCFCPEKELTRVSYLQHDACMESGEAQSVANLVACGVMGNGVVADTLIRAQAAELIVNAIELKENRALINAFQRKRAISRVRLPLINKWDL